MKILQLRFQNLNSLVGTWSIDFTQAEYVEDGLFAITGPTGVGKSTLLDALCLALYGSTPRLGRITQSSNDIMSRLTGECFAEVTFQSATGTFRCHWSQHKARRRFDGDLQPQKHEISDAVTQEILETRLTDVLLRVEQETGLNFEQFSRSILLAQGSFAAFLQAKPDERAPILEQITGTGIYTEISKSVFERHKEEQLKLKHLQHSLEQIELLTPEQEQEYNEQLQQHTHKLTPLQQSLQTDQAALTWLDQIAKLVDQVQQLEVKKSILTQEQESFKPKAIALQVAKQLAERQTIYSSYQNTQQQLNLLLNQQTELKQQQPLVQQQLEQAQQQETQAKQQHEQAQHTWKEKQPVFNKARSLLQSIQEHSAHIDGVQQKLIATEQDKNTNHEQAHQAKVHVQRLQEQLNQTNLFLQQHQQSSQLQEQIGQFSAQAKHLKTDYERQEAAKIKHSQVQTQVIQAQQELEKATQAVQANTGLLQAAKTKLDDCIQQKNELLHHRDLQEYKKERDLLLENINLLRLVASFEEHRKELQQDHPCPLCGSQEHPYVDHTFEPVENKNAQLTQLNALITRAETLIEQERHDERDYHQRQTEQVQAETKQQSAANFMSQRQHEAEQAKQELEELQTNFEKQRTDLINNMLVYVDPNFLSQRQDVQEPSVLELRNHLQHQYDTWKQNSEQKQTLEQQVSQAQHALSLLQEQGKQLIQNHTVYLQDKQTLEQAVAQFQAEKDSIYTGINPDEDERKLVDAIDQHQQAYANATQNKHQLQLNLTALEKQLHVLQEHIQETTVKNNQASLDFQALLTQFMLADEQAYLQAILSEEQRQILETQAKQLDHAWIENKTQLADRQQELATETAKQLTSLPKKELEQQCIANKEQETQLKEQISTLNYKLNHHLELKKMVAHQEIEIQAQQKETEKWAKLNELIGSADGKKYRNIVQGMTFDVMLGYANDQLEHLTDRYRLLHNEQSPLELFVIDAYQASEIRSTKNLSGGESFLVSLALALGLSNMASQNIRIDSLFLDEGFGTLDEDTLNTALEALSNLQQDGKVIGVISHVQALKDRISTQISIRPSQNGQSVIEGPGVVYHSSSE